MAGTAGPDPQPPLEQQQGCPAAGAPPLTAQQQQRLATLAALVQRIRFNGHEDANAAFAELQMLVFSLDANHQASAAAAVHIVGNLLQRLQGAAVAHIAVQQELQLVRAVHTPASIFMPTGYSWPQPRKRLALMPPPTPRESGGSVSLLPAAAPRQAAWLPAPAPRMGGQLCELRLGGTSVIALEAGACCSATLRLPSAAPAKHKLAPRCPLLLLPPPSGAGAAAAVCARTPLQGKSGQQHLMARVATTTAANIPVLVEAVLDTSGLHGLRMLTATLGRTSRDQAACRSTTKAGGASAAAWMGGIRRVVAWGAGVLADMSG